MLPPNHPDRKPSWAAFRWRTSTPNGADRSPNHRGTPLVVIKTNRIVYTEPWLRREGFAARQFWRRRENEPEGGERTGFHPDGDC